jgi:hypothetical protein
VVLYVSAYQLHGFVHLSQHLGRRRRSTRISPLHQFLFYFVQGQFFKSRVRFSVSFRFVLVGNNTDSVLRRFRSWTSGSLSPSVFFCDYQGLTLLCAYFKFYQFFSSVNYISILVYRRTRPEWLWLLRLRLRLGGRRVYTAVYGVEVAAGWAGMIVPRGYRRFGDGWVRFNRISNILPIRRLHPPHVLSNNHTEDLLRHRLSVRFWVQFRFQINITVKQVFVVLAYPLFFQGRVILRRFRFVCYIGQILQRLLELAWRGGRRQDDAVGRRVGVRLVCATVGFMRFVRVVVPLLLFVPL